MKLILFVCLLGAALAETVTKVNKDGRCKTEMKKGGLSEDFPKHVSHAIHSLTIEDIRMYFNKYAGENNSIPVVNPLLRDYPRVLKNAPYVGYNDKFVTDGMKHFDVIMRGVNMAGWNLTAFELLERLSHVYHMSEIWAAAGRKYNEVDFKRSNELKFGSKLCQCVRDTDGNGLAKYLELTAFQIRYPGITSGNKTITDSYLGGFLDYHISYGLQERPKTITDKLMTFNFTGNDTELIPRVIEHLMDESKFVEEPHDPVDEARHSKEHWEWCIGELNKLMSPELIFDAAVFMRCQLNLGAFAEPAPIVLSGAKQSSTLGGHDASRAIDGDISTKSRTSRHFGQPLWFQVDFPEIVCVAKVHLLQIAPENRTYLVWQMEDTSVKVLNSTDKEEHLCSTLKVKDNQTDYVLTCDEVVCGDQLKLTVDHHKKSKPNPDGKPTHDYTGCLTIGEIEVYPAI